MGFYATLLYNDNVSVTDESTIVLFRLDLTLVTFVLRDDTP